MQITNITDDGELHIELSKEELQLLIQKAVNDILREEIKKYETTEQG